MLPIDARAQVRQAYAEEDFEWDNCQRLAIKDIKEANFRLQREFLATNFRELDESSCPEDEKTSNEASGAGRTRPEPTRPPTRPDTPKTDEKTSTTDEDETGGPAYA
eukprot:1183246-Prorocentrum_minimum.AAC.3